MAGQYQNVTLGYIAPQTQQMLGNASQSAREAIAFGQEQHLNKIMSKHINKDGSLDQTGFINEAASSGYGPKALSAWYANQGQVLDTAQKQTMTNAYLKLMGLDSNAIRDQAKIGAPAQGYQYAQVAPDATIPSTTESGVKPSDSISAPATETPKVNEPAAKDGSTTKTIVQSLAPAQIKVSETPKIPYPAGFHRAGEGSTGDAPIDATASRTSNGDITGQVTIGASDASKYHNAEEAKLQAPPDTIVTNVPGQEDRRSIFERLADSGTGMPQVAGAVGGAGGAGFANIFDYNKVTNVGDIGIKAGIDSALAKLGQSQDQAGVDNLMKMAAQSIPTPVLASNKPEDMQKYIQELQSMPARQMEAQRKVASDLAQGNTGAIAEQLGREQFALTTRQNERAEQQVSHDAIKGYLPSPTEKIALTDASGAVREMQHLIKNPPAPNTPEWAPFKLMMAKSLVKAMSLPVGEGMVEDIAGKIQNGVDAGSAVDQASHGSFKGAAAAMLGQVIGSAMGINDIDGAKYLTKGASSFARNKWGAYGQGKAFNTYFPAYDYKGGPSSAPGAKAEPKAKDGSTARDLGKGKSKKTAPKGYDF